MGMRSLLSSIIGERQSKGFLAIAKFAQAEAEGKPEDRAQAPAFEKALADAGMTLAQYEQHVALRRRVHALRQQAAGLASAEAKAGDAAVAARDYSAETVRIREERTRGYLELQRHAAAADARVANLRRAAGELQELLEQHGQELLEDPINLDDFTLESVGTTIGLCDGDCPRQLVTDGTLKREHDRRHEIMQFAVAEAIAAKKPIPTCWAAVRKSGAITRYDAAQAAAKKAPVTK